MYIGINNKLKKMILCVFKHLKTIIEFYLFGTYKNWEILNFSTLSETYAKISVNVTLSLERIYFNFEIYI